MKKRLLVLATALLLAAVDGLSATTRLDSILTLIDKSITEFDTYVARKEARITFLRSEIRRASTPQSRYEVAMSLYEEYLPFVKDSAIYYLDLGVASAQTMGDKSKVVECNARKSLLCSSTGSFVESMNILKSTDTTSVDSNAMAVYYHAMCQVCNEIAYYSPIEAERKVYKAMSRACLQCFYATASPSDNDALFCHELDALDAGQLDSSLAINDRWLAQIDKGSHPYALATLYRYLEYKARHDTTEMMLWLGESVLTDIRRGVMDQGSMWEMANQIMLMGQVDRSYRYICFTSDCASRFGSRQRLSQISPLLNNIAQKYKEQVEASRARMRVTLIVISLLGVLLLVSLIYVWNQREKLRVMRDDLARNAGEMERLNMCLQATNAHLTEASKVRDEYMGRFMGLCSSFADRLDELRQKVSNRVKKQQFQDLYQLTRSEEFLTDYQDELYRNFDEAFLRIFPQFVEKFNALLRPECQVEPTEKGRLSTQIRIFAMIRLGITDSGQISEFLRYSVNTIYNYRAQVKKGAIGDRADFERQVMEIDS